MCENRSAFKSIQTQGEAGDPDKNLRTSPSFSPAILSQTSRLLHIAPSACLPARACPGRLRKSIFSPVQIHKQKSLPRDRSSVTSSVARAVLDVSATAKKRGSAPGTCCQVATCVVVVVLLLLLLLPCVASRTSIQIPQESAETYLTRLNMDMYTKTSLCRRYFFIWYWGVPFCEN